jgi:hypothetical protein
MRLPPEGGISVSEQLKKVPLAVRPIVRAARRMVKAIAPKAKEIAYRSQPPRSSRSMWKSLTKKAGCSKAAGRSSGSSSCARQRTPGDAR